MNPQRCHGFEDCETCEEGFELKSNQCVKCDSFNNDECLEYDEECKCKVRCNPLPGCGDGQTRCRKKDLFITCLSCQEENFYAVQGATPGTKACAKCSSITDCPDTSVRCEDEHSSRCDRCDVGHFWNDEERRCAKCAKIDNCAEVWCSSEEDSRCVKCKGPEFELSVDGKTCRNDVSCTINRNCVYRAACTFAEIDVVDGRPLVRDGPGGWQKLSLYGLRYSPAPIGFDGTVNAYDKFFNAVHERDLGLIDAMPYVAISPPLAKVGLKPESLMSFNSLLFKRSAAKRVVITFSLAPFKQELQGVAQEKKSASDAANSINSHLRDFLEFGSQHFCSTLFIAFGARPERWELDEFKVRP